MCPAHWPPCVAGQGAAFPESACRPHLLCRCCPVHRCQSTLAAIVAAQEVFPPARPCLCQRTVAARVALKKLPHLPAPLEAPPRHRAGGWERQAPRAPHLRPGCAGTGRCCTCKRALVGTSPLQGLKLALVRWASAKAAPLLMLASFPKHRPGSRSAQEKIPAHHCLVPKLFPRAAECGSISPSFGRCGRGRA